MGIAIVLVAAVSVGINRSGLLTADILRGDGSSVAASTADIGYTVSGSVLTVTSEKVFHDVQSITFVLVYNAATVAPQTQQSQTVYDFTSSSWKNGTAHVTVFLSWSIIGNNKLISIPLSGTQEDMVISDAKMLFINGSVDSLAIEKY